jgi:serine protease AprX
MLFLTTAAAVVEHQRAAVRAPAVVAPARVIVQTSDPAAAERLIVALGGRTGRRLAGGRALVAEVAPGRLPELAAAPHVQGIAPDRPIRASLDRTAAAIGARWVSERLGFDGTGVGVVIIDSGITPAHDDLGGNQVVHFADFVDGWNERHDRYGHGTHVAGIIAGSGHDSSGTRRGIAPGAHLVVLKTLDDRGEGFISNAIAALDYAVEQRAAYNIRVINLSVAAGVYESFTTDPLTLAAGRAVDAGIVVVTAAGNQGRAANGRAQYGGITAPGNAPWVLTVGAASHNGTIDRADDTVAPFSSMGPSAIDRVPKPDLVAPGVGVASLADEGSTLFTTRPEGRIWGTVPTNSEPYLSLSGTSMASPVVAGTAALMIEANPSLKPAAVKAILRASAEPKRGYSALAQGAGFLNARAAVELALAFARDPRGAARLENLVHAYTPAGAGAVQPDCGPECFRQGAGVVSGVNALSEETVVWDTRAAVRRQRGGGARGASGSPGDSE